MSQFTLRQLRYFCAIASTGSISAAAAQEHVSRSAVAAALDELERSLKSQLCTRHKSHGIVLTASGQHIFDQALSLLRSAENLAASAGLRELSGPLAIGCYPSLAPTILPQMVKLFDRLHPDVELSIHPADQATLLQQLKSGDLELAIMYNMHLDRRVETARLYDTAMHVILAAGHPLAESGVVRARDLENEPMILLDAPPSVDDIMAYFTAQGLSPTVRHRTRHFELARSLVAQGLGYSLFIQRPRNPSSYEGLPVLARALDPQPHLERVSVVWPAGRTLSGKARRFVELAQQHVASYEPEPLYAVPDGG